MTTYQEKAKEYMENMVFGLEPKRGCDVIPDAILAFAAFLDSQEKQVEPAVEWHKGRPYLTPQPQERIEELPPVEEDGWTVSKIIEKINQLVRALNTHLHV